MRTPLAEAGAKHQNAKLRTHHLRSRENWNCPPTDIAPHTRPWRGGFGLHVTMEQVSSLLKGIHMSFSPVSRPARSIEPRQSAPPVPQPPEDPRPPSFHAPHHLVLAADPGHRLAGRSTGTPRPESSRRRETFVSEAHRRVQAGAGTAVCTPRQLQAASPRSVKTRAATGLVHLLTDERGGWDTPMLLGDWPCCSSEAVK